MVARKNAFSGGGDMSEHVTPGKALDSFLLKFRKDIKADVESSASKSIREQFERLKLDFQKTIFESFAHLTESLNATLNKHGIPSNMKPKALDPS